MNTDLPYTPTTISKAFGAALAKAQSEMDTIVRNATNSGFKRQGQDSKYADISAVLEAVKPPLNNNGIALTMPALNRDDGCVGAYLELRFEDETVVVPPFWIKPASGIPHAMVSALTYSRRAAVTSYFSIPQEDDDGNTASDHGNENRQEYAPPRRSGRQAATHSSAEDRDIEAANAAAQEEQERRELEAKAQAKAEKDEALAAFKAVADKMGYTGDIIKLAKEVTRKEKFTVAELRAVTMGGRSTDWNAAVDKLQPPTKDPVPADTAFDMAAHEMTEGEQSAQEILTEKDAARTVAAIGA